MGPTGLLVDPSFGEGRGGLASEYGSLRKRLEDAGYTDGLYLEGIPLVQKLFLDLTVTTQSLEGALKEYSYYKEIATELELGVKPFQEENARLIRENSYLRMTVVHLEEEFADKCRASEKRLEELEEEKSDLKELVKQLNKRLNHFTRTSHLGESKSDGEKGKAVRFAQTVQKSESGRKFHCGKQFFSDEEEMMMNRRRGTSSSPVPSIVPCGNCTRIRNYAQSAPDKDEKAADYFMVTNARTEAFVLQLRKLKNQEKDNTDTIANLKKKIDSRNLEIERMRQHVSGYPRKGKISSGLRMDPHPDSICHSNRDTEMQLKNALLQLEIVQKRNIALERRMKSSILQDHDQFMQDISNSLPGRKRNMLCSSIHLELEQYPTHPEMSMEDRLRLLEIQLSNCCREKAELLSCIENSGNAEQMATPEHESLQGTQKVSITTIAPAPTAPHNLASSRMKASSMRKSRAVQDSSGTKNSRTATTSFSSTSRVSNTVTSTKLSNSKVPTSTSVKPMSSVPKSKLEPGCSKPAQSERLSNRTKTPTDSLTLGRLKSDGQTSIEEEVEKVNPSVHYTEKPEGRLHSKGLGPVSETNESITNESSAEQEEDLQELYGTTYNENSHDDDEANGSGDPPARDEGGHQDGPRIPSLSEERRKKLNKQRSSSDNKTPVREPIGDGNIHDVKNKKLPSKEKKSKSSSPSKQIAIESPRVSVSKDHATRDGKHKLRGNEKKPDSTSSAGTEKSKEKGGRKKKSSMSKHKRRHSHDEKKQIQAENIVEEEEEEEMEEEEVTEERNREVDGVQENVESEGRDTETRPVVAPRLGSNKLKTRNSKITPSLSQNKKGGQKIEEHRKISDRPKKSKFVGHMDPSLLATFEEEDNEEEENRVSWLEEEYEGHIQTSPAMTAVPSTLAYSHTEAPSVMVNSKEQKSKFVPAPQMDQRKVPIPPSLNIRSDDTEVHVPKSIPNVSIRYPTSQRSTEEWHPAGSFDPTVVTSQPSSTATSLRKASNIADYPAQTSSTKPSTVGSRYAISQRSTEEWYPPDSFNSNVVSSQFPTGGSVSSNFDSDRRNAMSSFPVAKRTTEADEYPNSYGTRHIIEEGSRYRGAAKESVRNLYNSPIAVSERNNPSVDAKIGSKYPPQTLKPRTDHGGYGSGSRTPTQPFDLYADIGRDQGPTQTYGPYSQTQKSAEYRYDDRTHILRSSQDRLEREKEEIRSDLNRKDDRLRRLEQKHEKLLEEYSNMQLQLKNALQELGSRGEIAKGTEREVGLLKGQLESYRRDMEHVNKEKEEAVRDARRLANVTSTMERERHAFNQEFDKRNKETEDLRRQVQRYIDEVRRIEELLAQKDEEMESILAHYRSLSVEKETLEQERAHLQLTANSIRLEARDAMDQNQTLRHQLTTQSSLAASYEHEIEKLTQTIAALETQLSSLADKSRTAENDVKMSRDLLYTSETKMDQTRLNAANAEATKTKLETENTDLRRHIAVLEEQIEDHVVKEQSLKESIADGNEKEYQSQRSTQSLVTERDQLLRQMESNELKLETLNAEIRGYRLKATELQNELERTKRQLQSERSQHEAAISEFRRAQSTSSTSALINAALQRGDSESSDGGMRFGMSPFSSGRGPGRQSPSFSAAMFAGPMFSSRSESFEHSARLSPIPASTGGTQGDTPERSRAMEEDAAAVETESSGRTYTK